METLAKTKRTRQAPTIKAPDIKPKVSPRIEREKQQTLFADTELVGSLPPLNLLDASNKSGESGYSEESLEHLSRLLELKLQDFGIKVDVVEVLPGPVVTRFEIQPAAGVKVSRISGLAKDLARSMAVISVRVDAMRRAKARMVCAPTPQISAAHSGVLGWPSAVPIR